jgi:hypothetical protein
MEENFDSFRLKDSSENKQYFKLSNDSILKLDSFETKNISVNQTNFENLREATDEEGAIESLTNDKNRLNDESNNDNQMLEYPIANEIEPFNVANVYLEFAKDALFYYLTAKKKQKNQHLKTLIEIFKYNENELKKLKEQNNLKDLFK